jgi:putative glycosyltransferase (TIGR04348 family)
MEKTFSKIVIVTPALANANNGNWQTAWRWQRFLAPLYPTRLVQTWPDEGADDDGAMIALHARRSAASIQAWHARHGGEQLAVVLTGTDLYRDIVSDADAQRSLALALHLVVLQGLGARSLPAEFRDKTRTIYQSAPARRSLQKTGRNLRALMVGHLREEKSPETLFAAACLLAGREDIFIDHIGDALDPLLGTAAEATMAACPNYRWLGGCSHEETRRCIQRAHVLIHASRMEGGAHVIHEAIVSGTPVLASRIDGNVGMLGEDYAGYFAWNDALELARLLTECRAMQGAADGLLNMVTKQARARGQLFSPATERAAVRDLARELMTGRVK